LGQDPGDIRLDPALRECSFGDWEGLSETDIAAQYPDEWAARSVDKWNTRPPGGESYADVEDRVINWLGSAKLPERSIVVCHGQTSRVLRGVYGGLTCDEMFALSETQDGFFELSNGQIRQIAADA